MNGSSKIAIVEWPQNAAPPVSLYFHIPFCSRKCDYCHFYVLPDKESYKTQLMEGLELEWGRWVPHLKNQKIRSIYFGGGTPTLLGPDRIQTVLSWVKNLGNELKELEITIEANPEEITHNLMNSYAKAGINRASVGIQSLDDKLLRRLSRQHSAEKAIQAVWAIQEAGIENISIDLMYDLPLQTIENWKETLHQVKKLPITHLSLYNLTIEPHTVFFKKQEKLKKLLPNEELSLQMYEMALDKLREVNLEQYEISAFCKNGAYSKHNVGYWIGRPFLGLGPSAFSFWDRKRFRNVANLNKYCQELSEGNSPIDFEEKLAANASLRELLAIHLRLSEGVNLHDFEQRHGRVDLELQGTLNTLEKQSLLYRNNECLFLTPKGVLFYDTVASEII